MSIISIGYTDGRWYNFGPGPLWTGQSSWGLVVSTEPPFCQKCSLKLSYRDSVVKAYK